MTNKKLDRRKICDLVREGVSDAEIARRVGSKNPLTITIIRTKEFKIKYPTRDKLDRKRIKQLLKRGWSDVKIAQYLGGVNPQTIGKIRVKEFGIYRPRVLDRKLILQLVERDMTDVQIARRLNASPLTIERIRTKELRRFKSSMAAHRKARFDRAKIGKLLAKGTSDAEIARRVGASKETIGQIRSQEFGITRRSQNVKKIEQFVMQGWTDQRIGRRIGRSRKTVQHIRTGVLKIKHKTGPRRPRKRR